MLWRRGWWGPGDGWSETHQSWFWDADTNWSSSQTIHFQNADTAQHATVSASTEQWTLLELRTETTGIVQFCSIIAEFYNHAKSHWEFVNKNCCFSTTPPSHLNQRNIYIFSFLGYEALVCITVTLMTTVWSPDARMMMSPLLMSPADCSLTQSRSRTRHTGPATAAITRSQTSTQ